MKRLKEERIGFDNQLAAIERTLCAKDRDHEELMLMSHDATHAKEVSKAELSRLEEQFQVRRCLSLVAVAGRSPPTRCFDSKLYSLLMESIESTARFDRPTGRAHGRDRVFACNLCARLRARTAVRCRRSESSARRSWARSGISCSRRSFA